MDWIIQHYKWIVDLLKAVLGWKKPSSHAAPSSTLTAQGAKVTNSPVASGSGITQTINSPTINLSLPVSVPDKDGNEPDLWLEFHPTGSRALRIQNSGAEPAFEA
jgi:hypothetical protein